MGGMVALEYALRYGSEVRGLVMAEAFPHLYSVTDVFGPPEDPVNDPYGYGSVFDHQTPEAVIHRVRKQMTEGVERLPGSLFQSLLEFDRRARVKELTIPVSLLIGDRRKFTDHDLADLVDGLGYSSLPNLKVELIPSHHFVMLEQPDQTLIAIRRFLDQFQNQD
jgi:pimeloyl-ACP methyl ester carboxylesterase